MKTGAALLGLLILVALPVQSNAASGGRDSSLLLQTGDNMTPADSEGRVINPALGGSVSITLANGKALVLDNQLSPTLPGPGLNGPAVGPVPVPEPGSSILFLVLGAFGMVALRRRLRAS